MNTDRPDGANPLVPAPADPIDPRHRPVVFYVPPRRVSPLRRAPGLAATTGSCLLIVPMLVIALANPSTSSSIAGTTPQHELVVPATGSEDPPATVPQSTAVPLPQQAATTVPSAARPPSVTVGTRLVAAAELSVVGSGRSAAVGPRTTSTTTSTTVASAKVAPAKVAPAKIAPAKVAPAKIAPVKVTPTTPSPQAPVPGAVPSPAPTPPCPSSAGPVITTTSGSTEGPVATIEGTVGSSTGIDSTPLATVPTETSTPK
jgi:hypothetical protein